MSRPIPRAGFVMAWLMLLLLLLATLGGAALLESGRARHQLRAVARRTQREFARDAALVHAFHLIKGLAPADLDDPRGVAPPPPGGGALAGIPYAYRIAPCPEAPALGIEVWAGEAPALRAHARAVLVPAAAASEAARPLRRWDLVALDLPEDPEPREERAQGGSRFPQDP